MSSPEAHSQERPLSAEQQRAWCSLVEKKALRPLQAMEALYLSKEEQEVRKDAPLANARYQEWLAWMEEIDGDPSIPFKQHHFVDEVVLVENIKAFTQAMEALAELCANGRISSATQDRLGLPKILQHISPEKLTFYSVTIGGKTSQQLEAELKAQGLKIGDTARSMMKSKDFTTEKHQEEIQLIRLTVDDLFHDGQNHITEQLFSKAKERGLELCPAEVAPHLRLKMTDQAMNEWLFVGMKTIADPDEGPHVFRVERRDDGSWLHGDWARPGDLWDPKIGFVFRLPANGGANSYKAR